MSLEAARKRALKAIQTGKRTKAVWEAVEAYNRLADKTNIMSNPYKQ